jgi:hypothetical protein
MHKRHFHLRMNCTYQTDKNEIDQLLVEVLKDDAWEALELNIRSPGFLLFISGLFTCQHLYMRTNCAERGLILRSGKGELQIDTNGVWEITRADANFDVVLKSGTPGGEDTAYILERMKHCPVSSNILERIPLHNVVNFLPE